MRISASQMGALAQARRAGFLERVRAFIAQRVLRPVHEDELAVLCRRGERYGLVGEQAPTVPVMQPDGTTKPMVLDPSIAKEPGYAGAMEGDAGAADADGSTGGAAFAGAPAAERRARAPAEPARPARRHRHRRLRGDPGAAACRGSDAPRPRLSPGAAAARGRPGSRRAPRAWAGRPRRPGAR